MEVEQNGGQKKRNRNGKIQGNIILIKGIEADVPVTGKQKLIDEKENQRGKKANGKEED